MRATLSRLARCVLALTVLLAAAGCGGDRSGDSVTIMVPWSGDEFAAFYAVVKTFEKDTGVRVNVQVTRALTQQLDAAVGAGAPPDLAILPSVGAIYTYAAGAKGLKPLGRATDTFLQPFQGLTKMGDDVYALPVKVDVKSLVWFRPALVRRPPVPAGLQDYSKGHPGTWCLGLESGPTSGWPGADWIADLVLSGRGVGAYEEWLSGKRPWNQVAQAWSSWRTLVGTSAKGAPTQMYSAAARGMTTKPPKCSLAHGALSAMGFDAKDVQKGRYDFVPSSATHRLEVSADFVGKFTTGNANADALAAYLAGSKAQQAWVDQPGGYAFSANTRVTHYANGGVQQRIAEMLRPHSGYTLCFGAADAMAPDVSAAFYRAVLIYAEQGGTDPSSLLGKLDQLQQKLGRSGKSPVPSGRLCATP
ncbi:extracellular solute-binding protein [Streptomyces sp. Li-HN-5-11]|uniref:extracellular solute-binding protein n=1 Tax=Streptomyces sp. Li-HN-5-11 TaxID=3075432 RepID=UPI0028AB3C4D|nr:extracellular solute-binding protein [Streptomyces sp. Li-HN-5-11]WNM34428.1 extracellular solute-binding protein [Streptomyces sp. Li-HN-5-11]